jgi:hypothetical protein
MSTSRRHSHASFVFHRVFMFLPAIFLSLAASAQNTAVVTYHNDTYRTGWNSTETTLTPANVNATQFGLLATATVDDEVDGVPLIIPNVTITTGKYQGTQHDVIYVTTANNSIYAIDASSGVVLVSTNLGTAVSLPLNCHTNAETVGVDSTPVIDTSLNNLYVIAYTEGSTGPTYTIHALNLGNLSDAITPQVVAASHLLNNGTSFPFNATYQRQRPALLEANGNIYAGFGSWCDLGTNLSRGWLLGWNASTLAPLPANQLMQSQATDPNNFFLASIWMSGYGPSADDSGNVLFVTANSDPTGTTYDGVTSVQESVVKTSPDLAAIEDLFTPDDWPVLDANDEEFGSGGVMVLPDQSGSIPHLAVAAGKDGEMYFMNEDDLGGYSADSNNVLGTYAIGSCWCGQSYFVYEKTPVVVSSGGDLVRAYELTTSPAPALKVVSSAQITTGQNSYQGLPTGFFTSVSSNGTKNPIIWALGRPLSKTETSVYLYALNPVVAGGKMTQLFTTTAGTWPYFGGRYNQVPVVANGKVYVASYRRVAIYGLLGSQSKSNRKK